MHGVECTNGLDWKRSPHASEHPIRDADQIASTFEPNERPHRRSLLIGTQTGHRPRTKNGASGFCDRQRGSNPPTSGTERLDRGGVMLEECCD